MKPRVVLYNTVSQLMTKIVGAGATFLVTFFLARSFGPEGYGDFVKITTYISLFFLIADFGLNAVYLQDAEPAHRWHELVGLRLIISIVLVFLSVALLAFLPQGINQGYTAVVRLGIILFSPAIIFQGFITSANAIFQKKLRYDYATIAVLSGSLATLGIVWVGSGLFSASGGTLFGVVGVLVGTIITGFVGFWFVRNLEGQFAISLATQPLRELFVAAIPLGLTLVCNLIYFHADSIILTLTRPTWEVGLYGLAYKVFEVALVFPTFFMNALYPYMIADLKASMMRKAFSILLGTSFLAVICVWVGAPLLTYIRPEFVQSIGALRVLALGLPAFFLTSLSMWIFIALKKQKLLVLLYATSMVINILLNVWLVPAYGFMAAAWITGFSEVLLLVCSFFLLVPILKKRNN